MAKRPDKISHTLERMLKARGLESRLSEYRILGLWERTVGDAIARHARPLSLRGKKLTLSVDSPAWMQQLSLLKPELIEKINTNMGRPAVSDITLRLGEVARTDRRPEEKPAAIPLDQEDREKIERYVVNISDLETRDAVKRVIEKDFMSRKAAAAAGKNKK